MTRKVVIICGPTATGKTALGIKLAQIFDGEIISADSRQIYTGMDIGTGKDMPVNSKLKSPCLNGWSLKRRQNPKLRFKSKKYTIGYRLLQDIPVWLIDICQPDQEFSTAHYRDFANRVIEDIWSRGKLPIVVGGTGFYIKSLLEPADTLGIRPDWQLRKQLSVLATEVLRKKLREIDSTRFERMNQSDQNNPRRLIRAIEVARHQTTTRFEEPTSPSKIKDYFIIGLKTADLRKLYEWIDIRVEERVKQGAEQEAKDLVKQYTPDNSVLATTIGYKQWLPYLKGEISQREAIKRWKFAEHAYARRQLTWFKKQPGIRRFKVDDRRFPQNVVKMVKEWYSKKENSTKETHGQN